MAIYAQSCNFHLAVGPRANVAGQRHSATVVRPRPTPDRSAPMKFVTLYIRVLAILGAEARLGWILAFASVALAAAQFIEPILFGRIVDALASAQTAGGTVAWFVVLPLVGAWVGFGLFIIVASTLTALHADRLAHRHSQVVRTGYFEHV